MTDYPQRRSSWKKQEIERKWHSIIGIFVTVVLVLAVINGVAKTFSLGKFFGKSSWDSRAAFGAVIATEPISVFIFNSDKREITLVKLNEDLYMATGFGKIQFAKISEIVEESDGETLAAVASRITRSPLANFVILRNREDASRENLEKFFLSFASFATPLKIIAGMPTGVIGTNIARIDQIRLWWQLKSLGVNNLKLVDATTYSQEIVLASSDKILGVDQVSLQRMMSGYLENRNVLEEGLEIVVVNSSGQIAYAGLVADFVTAIGGRVGAVESSEGQVEKSFIAVGRDSYTASYLAKIFKCDIKTLPSLGERDIKIVIGRDFEQIY